MRTSNLSHINLGKLARPLAIAVGILSSGVAHSAETSGYNLAAVRAQVDQGNYQSAKSVIQQMRDDSTHEEVASALAFEAERMRRIEMEFTLKQEDLLGSIQRYIPDATEKDVSQWNSEGLLEYKVINGERRYFRKAAYNLVHVSNEAAARTNDYRRFTDKAPLYHLHPHHAAVVDAHQQAKAPLKQRFEVTYSLTVDADAVPAGEMIRAWLPFPQEIAGRQEQVALLSSAPAKNQLAPKSQAQRTIYMERVAEKGVPTEFSVRYAFDSLSRFTEIEADAVKPVSTQAATSENLTTYLSERAPHIQFTPELRALSEKIVGDETNPYRIAQKLFTYVDQIPWAGAREYSTIRNISQYAAQAGHADCGQQTLLLITLLRMNGIPARWESGWEFSPEGFDTMHDWGEFYLAPYGWMPMDVTHGVLDSEKEAERWFYLGGLDSYRLIFNTDYSQPFFPAKQHFRSETVDSQRGEVEWRGGNLYFDQWSYNMDWKPVDSSGDAN
uniref:transglutaminase-like domain-containing protein n=1 Tax=Microbulbifer agarilyticus TaxID=260552 RepID=UPI0002E38BF4|nr:transglutaminase-like domain-containing protein [Microbulbifer agarilyticus]